MYRSCRHPHERLIVFFLLLQHTSMFANLKLKKETGEKKTIKRSLSQYALVSSP